MGRAELLEKTPMLEKIEVKRRRGLQRMGWSDSIIDSMDMNLSKLREIVRDREDWCTAVVGFQAVRHDLVTNNNRLFKKCISKCPSDL